MKWIFTLLMVSVLNTYLIGQSYNIQNDASFELNHFQKDTLREIALSCESIEITFFESSKSIAFSSQKHCQLFFSFIDTQSPQKLIESPSKGYLMFVVNGEFYCDANLFFDKKEAYLAFKKNNILYYHQLSEAGKSFFAQFISSL